MKYQASICKGFIGLFLTGYFWFQFSPELIAIAIPQAAHTSIQKINHWQKQNIIYLGEKHDHSEHHAIQLKIITELYQTRANSKHGLVVALEMFQRPFQPVLDRYLAKEITEAELRDKTEFDQRWGWDWGFYAPILRFAQAHQIPLIAINAPAEVVHKVATSGIDSLQGKDYNYIPSRQEINLDSQIYRQKLKEVYQAHVTSGQGNSHDENNFFAAQILWDETMAEAIADYYLKHLQTQIIVLVGKGHVMITMLFLSG